MLNRALSFPGKDLELLAEFEEDIKPAYFEVDIEAEPEIVTWGDEVTITVEVENTGGVEDTQIIKKREIIKKRGITKQWEITNMKIPLPGMFSSPVLRGQIPAGVQTAASWQLRFLAEVQLQN